MAANFLFEIRRMSLTDTESTDPLMTKSRYGKSAIIEKVLTFSSSEMIRSHRFKLVQFKITEFAQTLSWSSIGLFSPSEIKAEGAEVTDSLSDASPLVDAFELRQLGVGSSPAHSYNLRFHKRTYKYIV